MPKDEMTQAQRDVECPCCKQRVPFQYQHYGWNESYISMGWKCDPKPPAPPVQQRKILDDLAAEEIANGTYDLVPMKAPYIEEQGYGSIHFCSDYDESVVDGQAGEAREPERISEYLEWFLQYKKDHRYCELNAFELAKTAWYERASRSREAKLDGSPVARQPVRCSKCGEGYVLGQVCEAGGTCGQTKAPPSVQQEPDSGCLWCQGTGCLSCEGQAGEVREPEHVAWLRFRHSSTSERAPWLVLCNSSDEGAFRVYRHPPAEQHGVKLPPRPERHVVDGYAYRIGPADAYMDALEARIRELEGKC